MSVQQFIAINLMSISGLAILIILTYRRKGSHSWLAANAIVLIIGGAALQWSAQWSGTSGRRLLPLILGPYLLAFLGHRRVLMNRMRDAAFYAQLLAYLHPTALSRFGAALMKAQSQETIEGQVAALETLAERATPEQNALLQSCIVRVRDDWQGVLESIRRQPGATTDLKSLEMRALGEVGRIDEMVRVSPRPSPR